jgi:hypothetical protein
VLLDGTHAKPSRGEMRGAGMAGCVGSGRRIRYAVGRTEYRARAHACPHPARAPLLVAWT